LRGAGGDFGLSRMRTVVHERAPELSSG